MADQIADGMRFSRARWALHKHPSMFLELLSNPDCSGFRGFA